MTTDRDCWTGLKLTRPQREWLKRAIDDEIAKRWQARTEYFIKALVACITAIVIFIAVRAAWPR